MKGKLGRAASEREEIRDQTQKAGRQGELPETEMWTESYAGRRRRKRLKTWLQEKVLESDMNKPSMWPSDLGCCLPGIL